MKYFALRIFFLFNVIYFKPSLSVHILWAPQYCVDVKSFKDMVLKYLTMPTEVFHNSNSRTTWNLLSMKYKERSIVLEVFKWKHWFSPDTSDLAPFCLSKICHSLLTQILFLSGWDFYCSDAAGPAISIHQWLPVSSSPGNAGFLSPSSC